MRSTVMMKTMMGLVVTGVMVTASAGQIAAAGTDTEDINVSAKVNAKCTVATTALVFGDYDPIGAHKTADLPGTATVTITCTKNATASIALNGGDNANGTQRRMTDGAGTPSFLEYELYTDNGHSTVWDVRDVGAASSRDPRPFTVYGLVEKDQDVPAGDFSDTVTATVNF